MFRGIQKSHKNEKFALFVDEKPPDAKLYLLLLNVTKNRALKEHSRVIYPKFFFTLFTLYLTQNIKI